MKFVIFKFQNKILRFPKMGNFKEADAKNNDSKKFTSFCSEFLSVK